MSPKRPSSDMTSSAEKNGSSKPAVLVVEDEAAVGRMLEVALPRLGFTVHLADGWRQALDAYRRHSDSIEVVLLDVQMPELDGPGTLAVLRQVNPAVRVVFMSGNTGRYSEADLLALGAAAILPKPFRLHALGQVLWQAVRGHFCSLDQR